MDKQLVLGGIDGLGLTGSPDTVAEASVVRRDGQWWMALGGMTGDSRVVDVYSAVLPEGAALTSSDWRLGDQLADAPPSDGWDATGYHCVSYVVGRDAEDRVVERLYYASASAWESLYGPYRIGFLEWDGTAWVRHGEPVFTAKVPWECGTVLEPTVLYLGGRWLLRYTAGLADGRRSATGLAESADGIGGWRRIGEPLEGSFDALVVAAPSGFDLVTSRHPLDAVFTPSDGLWLAHGDTPDGPWGPARQILQTTDGTPWHDGGVWKPWAQRDEGGLVVFFNVAQRTGSAYGLGALGIGRLRVRRVGEDRA